jgi:DNA polymerase I-like protein with 3'-5' exonuclease and polymerase domains
MQLSLFEERYEPDWDALRRCERAQVIAVDVETETRWQGTGPKVDFGLSYPASITIMALAWHGAEGIGSTALVAPFDAAVQDWFRALIARPITFVAHNAVFDWRQLGKLTDGKLPMHIWDTQSMARLLHPAVNASYSLTSVAAMLGIPVPERQQALKSSRSKLHMLPIPTAMQYAQDDASLSLKIYDVQRNMPEDQELVDWECRAVWEYCRMTVEGIRLNVPFVGKRLAELGTRQDELAARLREDGLHNPSSSKARAKYLYHTKGIPLPKPSPDSYYFTRAGRKRIAAQPDASISLSELSTRSDVVQSYMEDGSPYIDQLRDLSEYMGIDWLQSTLTGLLDHAALDGRLHSLVSIATEAGRRASSYPHMQNWKMPEMAGVAIGDEGFTLVEIDYANAENVMAAFLSGDNALAAACRAEDFHSSMAAQYFGQGWERADTNERKRLRTMAKKITYGTAYGMGAERLGESIGVTTDEARRVMLAKDRAFAFVTRSRERAKSEARRTNMLRLWTGRKVAVPSAFVAWNYLCQGGVSELLKRAIVLVSEAYRAREMRSRVALDIHDALVLEVAHDEWNDALELASYHMTHVTSDTDNNRTDPPIRWVAQPKLDDNRHKWGAEQLHRD